MAKGLISITDAAGVINSGGILLLQTDTLPGLHARADNDLACNRIQAIKCRADGKPMVVLAANFEQVKMLCGELSAEQEDILNNYWPGPFSFILPAAENVCSLVTGDLGTVAVRVPSNEGLRSLIDAIGYPLASTSANLAGEPPCEVLSEAVSMFSKQVEYHWLDDSTDNLTSNSQPSALIDLTETEPILLRTGPLPFSIL